MYVPQPKFDFAKIMGRQQTTKSWVYEAACTLKTDNAKIISFMNFWLFEYLDSIYFL